MLWFFLTVFLFSFYPASPSVEAVPKRDIRGDQTENYWSRYGRIRLSAEKTLFHSNEDIPIRIRAENQGSYVIRIYPSSLPESTFQLFLADHQGREVSQERNDLSSQKRENGLPTVNFQGHEIKEIILAPGEVFEKVLYLNDFYQLKKGQEYRLSCYFYPDQRFVFFARSQNSLRIRIHAQDQSILTEGTEPYSRRGSLSLPQLSLSPEETVYLFLSAEMQEKWENYLKYLDLPKYITSYQDFAASYAKTHPNQRPAMLERFAFFLTTQPADSLKKFRILDTTIERGPRGVPIEEGRTFVQAEGVREKNDYRVRYKYRYTLEAGKNGFWKIVHVEANLIR